jgi:photosystem II stability/assembly factor-like uncharacterized protein
LDRYAQNLLTAARRVLCLLAVAGPLFAQPTPPAASKPDTMKPGGPFDRLRFRAIGPAAPSGRIDDFAVFEKNPAIFYVATATGGLWKTINNGTTFAPVFDTQSTSSIGDVTIAPNDPNVVWVGTGEANNRQSSSWGDGVYKSTDGGRTWKHTGLRESRQIPRIVVDPIDHDVVYVAALGDLWKAGGERGIYKTADGGQSWTRVLDPGPDAGGTELVMDPSNNKVLYAATYQRRRASWGFNGGGPASAVWKTVDGGRSWNKLENGLPAGDKGRIGLDIYRRNPDIVYARVEHPKQGGVYRSEDGGASWTRVNSMNPRPMYFSQIRIDPTDDKRIYVGGTMLHTSDDGGKTFNNNAAEKIHVDFHALWIDPANPDHVMIGSDGGVGVSWDRSKTYVWLPNLPVAQFYHVSYDMQTPYTVCGGLQDNDTWCGPSQVRSRDGIGQDEWFVVHGGDGFVALIDPTDPRIIYAESQEGYMSRVDRTTNERKSIRPEAPVTDSMIRWNWDTPILISPHDPATLYAGGNRLFRSRDRGNSWKPVSPDLTLRINRDSLALMGVKGKDITVAKNDGVNDFGTLFTIAESRKVAGLLYTGSDDGQVHVSRDAGVSWSNLTGRISGAPRLGNVSKVEPSKFADGTAYVTFDAHKVGDYGSYAWTTTDFGQTWKSIVGDLPRGQVIRTITEDLRPPDVLYLGTESGLWVTADRGKAWVKVGGSFPTVPVYEITLHPRDNDMIVATHGRAIWILDDLAPFQQYAAAKAAGNYLFEVEPAVQRSIADDRERIFEGNMIWLGQNPPFGARIAWHLGAKADSVAVVVKEAGGAPVRRLRGSVTKDGLAAGVNSVVWDLRVEPIPGPRPDAPLPAGQEPGGTDGPLVLPGEYQLALVVNGKETATGRVRVTGEPDITLSDADRRARFDALRELQALGSRLQHATAAIRKSNEQLTQIKAALTDSSAIPVPIRATLDSLTKSLDSLKKRFGVGLDFSSPDFDFNEFRKNLGFRQSSVTGGIDGATAPATEDEVRQIGELRKEVPGAIAEVNAFVARLPAFYKALADAGLYPVAPKPVPPQHEGSERVTSVSGDRY